MNKLDFNKKMIGKIVTVLVGEFSYTGRIEEVVDEEHFTVINLDLPHSKRDMVSIYDIRSKE